MIMILTELKMKKLMSDEEKNVNEHCTEVAQKLIKVANDVKLFVKKGDCHRTFTALGLKVSGTSSLMRKNDYV